MLDPKLTVDKIEALERENAELKNENRQLKIWKTFSNTDWKDPDLDYILAMCGAMARTMKDALDSFDDHDFAICPDYIRNSVIAMRTNLRKDEHWFEQAYKRMFGCGRGHRPTALALQKLEAFED